MAKNVYLSICLALVCCALAGCSEESATEDPTNSTDTTSSGADSGGDVAVVCGNGQVEAGEACDDGPDNSDERSDACRTNCSLASCGDGIVDDEGLSEACDDGNQIDDDGCNNVCRLPSCGDGTLQTDEQCDDGPQNSDTLPDACRTNCRSARCGDSVTDTNEDCDDANNLSNDACLNCVAARCGDGFIRQNVESCDDTNTTNQDGCNDQCFLESEFSCQGEPSVCTPICGDGFTVGSEACDDGNFTNNDGCTTACAVEPGWECSFATCAPIVCAIHQHVQDHACVACAAGMSNPTGDDASGPDTACTPDPCFVALGVLCADFEQAYLKASNTDPEDYFGFSVAIDGDTLAVGTRNESSNATGIDGNQFNNSGRDSGAVYVFVRSGTTWTQQAYVKASNTNVDDIFGYSIALSGDTLAVGAVFEDSAATGINGDQADNAAIDSGAVYVFVRSGTTWTQQAYVKASNTGTNDYFGFSVALSGDTLAVGARAESSNATGINGSQSDNSAAGSGAAYVFTRSGTTWTQQAYVKASNTDPNDYFGQSIALDGDTLAVGARNESSNATGINGNQSDNSAASSGAVYVFTRAGTTWTQAAYVKASNTGTNDYFGWSVALSGDTLAVGAYFEDSTATDVNGVQSDNSAGDSGAVYVFTRSGGAWTQQAYIKASNTDPVDHFGQSVALDGDTLAVGARDESSASTGLNNNQFNNFAESSGAVYVFVRAGTTWTQTAYIKASNTNFDDLFGYSVALSGDTLVIGASDEESSATGINGDQDDNAAPNSGAVYVRKIQP